MNILILAQSASGLGFFEVMLVGLVSIGGYLAVFRENNIGWYLCGAAVAFFALDLFGIL